jgi:hypothetical protein
MVGTRDTRESRGFLRFPGLALALGLALGGAGLVSLVNRIARRIGRE